MVLNPHVVMIEHTEGEMYKNVAWEHQHYGGPHWSEFSGSPLVSTHRNLVDGPAIISTTWLHGHLLYSVTFIQIVTAL